MFAGFDQQAVFGGQYHGGAFGATKSDPAIYDNLTKVAGTHTMKFGFYWDMNGNQQSSGNQLNGTYDFETYGSTTTGNVYADFLLGRASGYNQANIIPVDNLKYHQYSLYAQDSWKIGKRLTVNYGLRADHIGQWYPGDNLGTAVFNVGAFLQNPNATNAGLQWTGNNSSIPLSGFKSPTFYYEPRLGFAYDLFGDGKTVLRGGFAIFRYQIAYNTISSPSEIPEGAINYSTPGGLTSLSQISTLTTPSSLVLSGCNSCSISPLQMGDGKTPYTENYNFSVDRQLVVEDLAGAFVRWQSQPRPAADRGCIRQPERPAARCLLQARSEDGRSESDQQHPEYRRLPPLPELRRYQRHYARKLCELQFAASHFAEELRPGHHVAELHVRKSDGHSGQL